MFSFGWTEIAITFLIVIVVIGPKEIPNLIRYLGSFSRSLKKISREFKISLNEISSESGMDEVKNSIKDLKNVKKDLDPTKDLKKEIESLEDTKKVFENEINKDSVSEDK